MGEKRDWPIKQILENQAHLLFWDTISIIFTITAEILPRSSANFYRQ